MSRPFVQLDVFAARPGDGNPLAVVFDAASLDEASMQAIARWTRLPETTFVLPPSTPDASYRLRIFSPRREVPFAGHPSIGSAHAVLEAGLAAPREGLLVQECAVGLLPIRVDGEGTTRRLSVRAPRARVLEVGAADSVRLRPVLDGLPPKVRHAFLLSQLEGLKYDDIAARLSVSVSMVKKYMLQAITHCVRLRHP